MFSNRYIFIYSSIMVIIVAAALSFTALQLKPLQLKNIEIEKKRNILASVNIDVDAKNAEASYAKSITESFVVNNKGEKIDGNAFTIELVKELKKSPEEQKLPVFVSAKNNGEKCYILPLRGKGLWGPVWGFISFNEDMNTVYGIMFDHKGETPGLGAEISTKIFQQQFLGKQIFDENQSFVSVKILKGGADDSDMHAVDAISGGTITSNAVSAMLFDCLKLYEPFIKNNRK